MLVDGAGAGVLVDGAGAGVLVDGAGAGVLVDGAGAGVLVDGAGAGVLVGAGAGVLVDGAGAGVLVDGAGAGVLGAGVGSPSEAERCGTVTLSDPKWAPATARDEPTVAMTTPVVPSPVTAEEEVSAVVSQDGARLPMW